MISRLRLFAFSGFCLLFTGCAAGQVYIAKAEDGQANCSILEKEMDGAQTKIGALEKVNHDLKNIRDVVLSVASFAFPPLTILNAILTVSDSHVADYAETEALKGRYNSMVTISNQKECGYKYAMITDHEDSGQ
mgnify:CR=1 FL=1|jgi:hypothetical protein